MFGLSKVGSSCSGLPANGRDIISKLGDVASSHSDLKIHRLIDSINAVFQVGKFFGVMSRGPASSDNPNMAFSFLLSQ